MNDERVEYLRVTLMDPAVGRYAANVSDLPALPETYAALCRAAADPLTSVGTIAEIVERDPMVSVRLLQLVNSAFFGTTQRTSSIPKAVSVMGTNLLKSLVLSAHMCNAVERFPTRSFSMSRYQQYAIRVARLARRMAGSRECADDAFTAGIMLGIGQLVFALKAPELFERVLQRVTTKGELQHKVELELLGTTRAEVGAFLLSNWGIPSDIVECVALHLQPGMVGPGNCELLALVHAADALTGIIACRETESRLDLQFLARAGLIDELPRWRRFAETAGELDSRAS